MDISFIVVFWVIISIVQAISERKKDPPPPQIPPNFEIPTLANAPNKPAEIEEINLEELYQQRKESMKNSTAEKFQTEVTAEEKFSEINLTPNAIMNSIIMNEILDKPKALRKRR